MNPVMPAVLAGVVAMVLGVPALAQAPAAPAPGQPLPRLVIGAPGRCQMTVDGQSRLCTSGLVYVHSANNSILLSVQSGRDVTIGFQGDSDRQPRPEEYTLFLTRLHTSVSGRSAAKEVRGTCEIRMSADGKTWHTATCRATDRNGMVTVVTFTGDGRQVVASRPGDAPASTGAAPSAPPAPGASPPKS